MPEIQRSLTMLIYGESGVGKSTLAVTAPYPRLMLEVESTGHKFLPINVRYWDPLLETPPIADGTWDTCIVMVDKYDVMIRTYQWLQSGQHQFRSLIVDSVTEMQVKCIDSISGTAAMKQQQWGELLRHMGAMLRDFRDLPVHATNPLQAVVLTAWAKKEMDGRTVPNLQGQIATHIPYLYDIAGALVEEETPNVDPTQPPIRRRRLLVESTNKYMAKQRVQGRLGSAVEQNDLNIERMLDMVYGPAVPTVPATTE